MTEELSHLTSIVTDLGKGSLFPRHPGAFPGRENRP